jgi:hypothetical protein
MHCLLSLNRLPRKYGYIVSDVYYSDENGDIIKTNIKSLLEGQLHISRGHR